MAVVKKRLGELLMDAGVIDEHQLRSALGHQKKWGCKLGQALVDLKLASEPQIVAALSKKLGYEPLKHLDRLERTAVLDAALKLLPGDFARAHNLVPLAADAHSVTVAMSDPTNIAVVDEIAFRSGRRVRIALAGDREVARAVKRFYFPDEVLERSGAIDIGPPDETMETTYDFFAAMPPAMRERYTGESAPPKAQPAATGSATSTVAPPPAAPVPASRPQPTPMPIAAPAAPPTGATEAALADAIDRMLRGEAAPGGLDPARLSAALARVLIRKGILGEGDLLAELMRR